MEQQKVQILMSTYNGKKYLREQIESLLSQTYSNIEILIRDDGSKDGTISILEEYSQNYPSIKVFKEENIGVVNSFFNLLKKSEADYIAFCDQDDIWLENKVEKAIEKLQHVTEPALYCSNKILIDADNHVIAENHGKYLSPSFENAVVECICTGCTTVLNQKLAQIIRQNIPKHAMMHDWWCYLVATYHGKVIFDENSYIWYRQHGNNEIGASDKFWDTVKAKAKHLKKSRGKLENQLREFHELYQGDKEKDTLVLDILNTKKFAGKCKMLLHCSFVRQSKLDQIIAKILLLINRLL